MVIHMNKKVTTNVPKVSGIKRIRAFADRDKNFNKMSEAIIRRAENTEVGEDDIASLGIGDGLPRHYVNTANGLFYIGGQKPVQVCTTPVVPVALFCGKDKESGLGIRLMTGNGLGKYVKALVRFEDIVQSGAQVVGKLADRGFCVGSSPQQFALFDRFLQRCRSLPLPVYLMADAMGFVSEDMAFLHGHEPVVTSLTGFDYLLPGFRVRPGLHKGGALEEWINLIRENVHGWAQTFALSASFASMLLVPAGMDVGMFHFHGVSTTGKTLLLMLAASVHGDGSEPGSGGNVNIIRWNTTPNAMERLLADYSGLVACVDELGASNHKQLSSLLYNITSGTAKERLTRSLTADESFKWRMFILSTGEMSISEKLAEQKAVLQGGQEHRAISMELLPEDAQKPDEPVSETRARADALKTGLAEVYGHAGPAFIGKLLSGKNTAGGLRTYAEFSSWLQEQTDAYCNALEEALRDEGRDITRVQRRGLKRFALVWLAGEKALKYGLLPFESDAVAESVMSAARRWLDDNQNQYNPVRNMLEELQLTLVTKSSRHFITLRDEHARCPGDMWGFVHYKTGDFLIYESVFEKLCSEKGLKTVDVARPLERSGYLLGESAGHYKKRALKTMAQSYYQVKKAFLKCNVMTEF